MTKKPIFFDATGRRAARISLMGWVVAVVSTVLGIAFIASLVVAPQMESVTFTNRLTAIHLPELVNKATDPGLLWRECAANAAHTTSRPAFFCRR
jgi:hypothetical protein